MAILPHLITGSTALFKGGGPLDPNWPFNNFWLHWLVFTVIIIGLVLSMVMGFIWFERRFIGRLQARVGPNRAGPFGLLQPVAPPRLPCAAHYRHSF